jgi:hypothetical protein
MNQNKLWNVISRIGIPKKLIRRIKLCVQGSKFKVSFGGDYLNDLLLKFEFIVFDKDMLCHRVYLILP